MNELPFSPYSETLRNVLRKQYIKSAALWLLGKDENSVLAQEGNSTWEAALTLIFLADASDIFAECNEEPQLREIIRYKSAVVARWLLSKKIVAPDQQYVYWEKVTWDTSVAIRGLLTVLKKYENSFSEIEREDIRDAVVKATKWIYHRFSEWEAQVKYPFGPADIAQIVITILYLAKEFPAIYERVRDEYYGSNEHQDLAADIIEYLLHKKTEKTFAIETVAGAKEDIVAYWWDDYFSTAEVVEALGRFYEYCHTSKELIGKHKAALHSIKVALIRACTYFEQGQVEGMWGSHIETIKVIYAYVMIRRLIPQRESGVSDPLIVPEIHTTFKALRWMCDEKQAFSDGSFLHTMFLTIFYSLALAEVYKSWEPAHDSIEKIYDDVVWFSPVRTTPERSKRLAAELKNSQLQDDFEQAHLRIKNLSRALHMASRTQAKVIMTAFVTAGGLICFLLLGNLSGVATLSYKLVQFSDFIQYLAVFVTIFIGLMTVIWNYDTILSRLNRRASDGDIE